MEILAGFYRNEAEREAVKAFLIECLKEMAVGRVFDKQTVAGIYDARKIIDLAFQRLEELYGVKEKEIVMDSR